MAKVSICLPNLNTARYLPERLDSILAQTFSDWECVVSDNFSDDGAWDILRQYGEKDSRFKLAQAAKDERGMYPNWNNCIRRATGDFVYFATSDDTMAHDCLEKMVGELERHPECGLCQCGLDVIDEQGRPHSWRWQDCSFGRFAPEWLMRKHVRAAPMDGLLHFALQTVYTSITQVLMRRSVFEKYGLFETRWGSAADFEWGMRVGLLESCVYIPEVLASWRVHPSQATGQTESSSARRRLLDMATSAYGKAIGFQPAMAGRLPSLDTLSEFYEEQIASFAMNENRSGIRRSLFLLRETLSGSRAALRCLCSRHIPDSFREESQFRRLRALLDAANVPAPCFAD
ncbi:MAG: glycosyltransferase [Planctomycetia bacterium]|jgi:GT2 family glycosyltransferase